jgi:hypothetical protein
VSAFRLIDAERANYPVAHQPTSAFARPSFRPLVLPPSEPYGAILFAYPDQRSGSPGADGVAMRQEPSEGGPI